MPGFKSHYITANGIRVHYLREGRGPTLLLLHGWPEFCRVWRKCMPDLAAEFDVIAPDLRGFGDTEKPAHGPSGDAGAEVHAADILALMDGLGLERVGIVSHDVGAHAAQWIAHEQPERLHWAHDPHAFDEDLEAWVDNFMKPGNLQGGFNWYISAHQARLAVIRGEAPRHGRRPISVPARVLWGASDPVLKSEWTDRLDQFFSDVEITIAPEAGHFVHYEQPALACREIEAFFRRV